MGQAISSDSTGFKYTEEKLTKKEIQKLFQRRVSLLFAPNELAAITARLKQLKDNSDNLVTIDDLQTILTLSCGEHSDENRAATLSSFGESTKVLYMSLVALGQLPFLKDALNGTEGPNLNGNGILVASAVYMGRIGKIWPTFNQLALFFVSLAISLSSLVEKDAIQSDSYVVKLLASSNNQSDLDGDFTTHCKRVQWPEFGPLTLFDDLDLEALTVSFHDLLKVLTFLLIVSSVEPRAHLAMSEEIVSRIAISWTQFEAAAMTLLRYFDPTLNTTNCKLNVLTYNELDDSTSTGIPHLMTLAMNKIFKLSLLLAIRSDKLPESTEKTQKVKEFNQNRPFSESRLLKRSTIAVLSIALSAIDKGQSVSSENLVELYNGSKCGFSLRSLELKVFKWQAATILLVSGKRLKAKTMETNKRYHTFDSEFPRWFRSNENHNRNWQSDLDVLTYAVYINHPWTHSNKNNFGNESTTIISILPRYDVFTTKKGLALGGKLIYFNTLGMGLGFGNEQAINKNNVRKYQPGTISLTIESNLEFGVFRHLPSNGAHSAQYFENSNNKQLAFEDYEDRFMITDLEVWGVGSSKELEEQRKQWEWEEKQAMARQSVNIRNLGEDRAFLEMAGLVGNHAGGGSI